MMTMTMLRTPPSAGAVLAWLAAALLLLLGGCQAPAIQNDLEAARAAYERGRNDPAVVRNASAELERAREALAEADDAWATRRDDDETRHLSVLATRKAQLAWAIGQQGAAEERLQQVEAERRAGAALAPQALRDQAALRQALQPMPLPMRSADERGVVVTLHDVLFRTGKADLRPATWRTVDRLVQVLEQFPAQRVVITGHADSTGPATRNLVLSQRRAEALKSALVSRGIAPQRVLTRGYGERLPIADNTSVEGRALNRRVEVVFPQARVTPPVPRLGAR